MIITLALVGLIAVALYARGVTISIKWRRDE